MLAISVRRLPMVVLLAVVVGSCQATTPVRPPAPILDTVGVLSGIREGNDRTTYSLADGRQWSRAPGEFRILYDMPAETTLFVAGSDGQGPYVLLIGGQEGLPADCPYALRYGGVEWGDAIESQGVLWPKATEFQGLSESLRQGAAYPNNAGFCLDENGAVTAVYLAEPASSNPAPVPSATA